MNEFLHALQLALHLVTSGNAEIFGIVVLSLAVSLTASVMALLLGAPFGAWLAVMPFRGRCGVILGLNALLGLPPVVIGLAVYLLLSRSGPLGDLGLLFTPQAMVIGQTILTLPIVAALVHRAAEQQWMEYGDTFRVFGASISRRVTVILAASRLAILTAFLAAFGRAIAEVGAIIVIGGNIKGYTRTMTTAIALETSKRELALALALGGVLMVLALAVNAVAFALSATAPSK